MIPISFTFDDGRACHVTPGSKVLDEFGVNGTFYVCPGVTRNERFGWKRPKNHVIEMASWGEIEEAHNRGHEIGNHSWSHTLFDDACRGKTKEEVEALVASEIMDAAELIDVTFEVELFSWAWPCHRIEPRVAKYVEELHVGVRPPKPRGCYIAILSKKSYVKQLNEFADMLVETGQWGVPIIHDMGDERGRLPEDVFRKHIEYVLSKPDLKIMTVAEVLSEARP